MKLYQKLASLVDACHRCIETGNAHARYHGEEIIRLSKKYLPHGSGFDSGTTVNLDHSTGEKLVFDTSFHHMNEDGYYDGWTHHRIFVRPSLRFALEISSVSGSNRNDIKEYIAEALDMALETEVE